MPSEGRVLTPELPWEDLTPDKPYATYPCVICRRRPGDSDNGACQECAYSHAGVPDV